MKRRWEVRWYEHNLTQENRRRFFTDIGANFFAWWIEFKYDLRTMVYEVD